jgi:predicted amino acid-binding ACT domain protein
MVLGIRGDKPGMVIQILQILERGRLAISNIGGVSALNTLTIIKMNRIIPYKYEPLNNKQPYRCFWHAH